MSTDRRQSEAAASFLMENEADGTRIPVVETVTVGRGDTCTLVLASVKASRVHAKVWEEEDTLWVEDQGSTNGTYRNEEKIENKTKFDYGDSVRFADVVFRIIMPTRGREKSEAQDKLKDTIPGGGETVFVSSSSSAQAAADKPAEKPAAAEKPPAPAKPEAAPPAKSKEPDVVAPHKSSPSIPTSWADSDELEQASHTRFVVRGASASDSDVDATDPLRAIALARRSVPANEPILVGLTDPIRGKVIKLQRKKDIDKWEMGRNEAADILIDDESVSGRHAQLVCEHGRWKVVNMMSVNGTFVNGRKALSAFLNPRDRIRMGTVELVFDGPVDKKARKVSPVSVTRGKAGGLGGFIQRLLARFTGRSGRG